MADLQQRSIEFRPSLRRYFFVRIPQFIGLYLLGVVLASVIFGLGTFTVHTTLVSLAGFLTPWVIFSFASVKHWAIVISVNEIIGPSGRGWSRVAIPLKQFNPVTDIRQSKLAKLLDDYEIKSLDGKQVYIDSLAFGKKEVQRILAVLNDKSSGGAASELA